MNEKNLKLRHNNVWYKLSVKHIRAQDIRAHTLEPKDIRTQDMRDQSIRAQRNQSLKTLEPEHVTRIREY
jgi:hypothetical protein